MNQVVKAFEEATPFLPEPDMSLLSPERPSAPVMPDADFEVVFGAWAQWIRDAAECKNAPIDYISVPLLAAAGAAIGNARWASPWSGWREPPIIWSALVGLPSSNKSPGLDAVVEPLREYEAVLRAEFERRHGEWSEKAEVAKQAESLWKRQVAKALEEGEDPPAKPREADPGREPVRDRIRITDATVEKVADILSESWRGLLLCRDELSGWLANMSRYSNGSDRPFWLEAYGGRSYEVDRKSSPIPIRVDHCSVGIVGGVQPDKLQSLLLGSTDDDGLLARMWTVWPSPRPLSRPRVALDIETLKRAVERLHGLTPVDDEKGERRPFFLDFTPDAQDALQEFRQQCREWEAGSEGLMLSHVGKFPGMAVRLACVLSHLDWAIGPEGEPSPHEIDAATFGRACHFIGEYLRLHAVRAYGSAALSQEVLAAMRIARMIDEERPSEIAVRDVQRRNWRGLMSKREIEAALDVLVQAAWLLPAEKLPGITKSRTVYRVSPRLKEASR